MALKLENRADEIMSRVAAGESCSSIARSMGEYLQAVTSVVKKRLGKSSLRLDQGNVRYFQYIDTPAKAYLLGFIAADGCIQNFTKSSVGLSITIHARDREVLDYLKKEIGNEHQLQPVRNGEHIRFTLASKQLVSDLESHGICQRKSLTMPDIFSPLPEGVRKYAILGYFDGDGSISSYNSGRKNYVQIRGTEEALLSIVRNLQITSYHMSRHDSIPSLVIGARNNVRKFYDIYEGCPVFLQRKKLIFDSIFRQDQTIS